MDAGKEHIGAVIEDRLRAVAMVVVDVEHRDPRQATIPQRLGRQRGIVQKTVAAEKIGAGVVTGRAAQRECGTCAVRNRMCGIQRAEGPLARRHPGSGRERRAGVERKAPAKLAGNTSVRKPWLGRTSCPRNISILPWCKACRWLWKVIMTSA